MRFGGFPEEALAFYEGLEADNSKPYWTDHKAVYEQCVRQPMEALLSELGSEFGTSKVFRPYRDVRFARDKSPYKTEIGAVAHLDGTLYVQLSAAGLLAAGGIYETAPDQVERMRRAVADDVRGPELERIVATLRQGGYEVDGHKLKTMPRGYPADHPRAELLRLRSITGWKRWPPQSWLHKREALNRVRTAWRAFGPLNVWIAANVGGSDQPRR